jgi:hypothetical protein
MGAVLTSIGQFMLIFESLFFLGLLALILGHGAFTPRTIRKVAPVSALSWQSCSDLVGLTVGMRGSTTVGARAMSPPRRSVWELVKEEIDGGNLAVPDD